MGEKTCVTCHELQPLTAFNLRRSAKDGRQDRCRTCCQAWYLEHRVAHMANVRVRNDRTHRLYRQRLAAYLREHPCVDCGQTDLRVLEFDHREGEQKLAEVTVLSSSLAAWHRVQAEIDKCDVRCANCHRLATAERGGHWRHMFLLTEIAERIAQERRTAS